MNSSTKNLDLDTTGFLGLWLKNHTYTIICTLINNRPLIFSLSPSNFMKIS